MRDGHGVSDQAIDDAVENPLEPPQTQPNGTYKYEGTDAVVILNERGELVATWARNSNGRRQP
jgi:hypothetical protein